MLFFKNLRAVGLIFPVMLAAFGLFSVPGAAGVETLGRLYPGLSQGLLQNAGFGDLEDGLICTAGSTGVTRETLDEMIAGEREEFRGQLTRNLLFVLDQHLMKLLLLEEARKTGIPDTVLEDEAIGRLLEKQAASVSVEDSELQPAYEAIKEILGGVSFEQVEEALRAFLLKEKQSDAVGSYLASLGSDVNITLDRRWAEEQAGVMLDNPVDRARASGVPTLVEFGAAGCRPCDMMQPILDKLKEKYSGRLNVVFIHVGEEQILGARYGVSSIPVQAFFDASGREVNRHVGFLPEADVEEVLASMGVSL